MTAFMTVSHKELLLTDVGSDTSDRYLKLGKLQGQVTKWDFSTKALDFQLWKFGSLTPKFPEEQMILSTTTRLVLSLAYTD